MNIKTNNTCKIAGLLGSVFYGTSSLIPNNPDSENPNRVLNTHIPENNIQGTYINPYSTQNIVPKIQHTTKIHQLQISKEILRYIQRILQEEYNRYCLKLLEANDKNISLIENRPYDNTRSESAPDPQQAPKRQAPDILLSLNGRGVIILHSSLSSDKIGKNNSIEQQTILERLIGPQELEQLTRSIIATLEDCISLKDLSHDQIIEKLSLSLKSVINDNSVNNPEQQIELKPLLTVILTEINNKAENLKILTELERKN